MAKTPPESYLFEAWYPPDVFFSEPPELDANDCAEVENGPGQEMSSRFLSLPVELRLCIYHWVHLMSPIRHIEPGPGYPMPRHIRYVLQPIEMTTTDTRLSPDRPLAGLPTSLLRTCRQVYHEARTLPFATNEFVFVNWLWSSSGLRAAAAVARAQRPWQRRAVRHVRLEVRARELGDAAWAELPAGLRGLRVKIVGRSGEEDDDDGGAGGADRGRGGLVDAARGWVEGAGLAGLCKLERLEVELEEPAWDKRQKLEWCAEVQRALREMGSGTHVACMERVI